MALKKPSDLFDSKADENNTPVIESDSSFREELIKVESLSEQVIQLQQELSQKVIKNDLESLVLSQINNMQENFEYLQNDFRKSNKKDIAEFKEKVSELTEIVGNLVENELPKYKKQVTKNEVRIGDKFDELKEVVEENIVGIREEIDSKVNDIVEVVDNNLEYFNNQLQETSSEVKKTTDTYNKLSKIVESKVSKENEKLEEYSQVIQSLHEAFVELEKSLQEESSNSQRIVEKQIESYKNEITSEQLLSKKKLETYKNKLEISVDNRLENYQKELKDVKADVVINEQHIKNVDEYLKEHHQELVELKEEVFSEIGQIPVGDLQENLNRLEKKIDFIKETYSKIEPEVIVKEVLREGLLNEPPDTKNSDPLTPLDQNFVTLDQLQNHYRLFINRIQQQLSTIGGGGETRLEFLDDVDRDSAKQDGYVLQFSSTEGKFIGTSYVPGGGGGESYWASASVGIHTTSNVGIGTTRPISKLDVRGDVSIASTVGIGTIIDIIPYDTLNSGTLSFEGSAGQLFSITNNLTTGSIYSVNDVSGIPSIDVDANGTIQFAAFGGNVGLGTTNPTSKLSVVGNTLITGITTVNNNFVVSGFSSVTDTRFNSVSEKTTIGVGNTVSLVYNTGGGNIGIITSPSGPVALNVTGIPTDSSFNNRSLTFSVMVNQGSSVSYACSSVTLNGLSTSVRWTGGIVAVGATNSYDAFNFTCINPIGSASTTANYVVLGVLNGNFK